MDVMKLTLEEFIKMCDSGECVAREQAKDIAKFQNLLNRIMQTCGVIRDCYNDCGAGVIFASSRGKDEKVHLTAHCDSNFALTTIVGLIEMIISNEDIPTEILMEEIKNRIFNEEE